MAGNVQECDECANVKLTQQTVELSFEIEKGMDTGYVITLGEAGEPHADGDNGDLNIHVVALPDPLFRREGSNLKMNWEISLADALTGFSQEIKHLDGHTVRATLHESSALHASFPFACTIRFALPGWARTACSGSFDICFSSVASAAPSSPADCCQTSVTFTMHALVNGHVV